MSEYIIFVRVCLYVYKVKLVTVVEGDPKAPFTTPRCSSLFSGLTHFTLDPYVIMLRVKQERIKYNFMSLWYDLT